jgi:hypothetical protein
MDRYIFVPVIGYVPNLEINPFLGYELWYTDPARTTPYIAKLSISTYKNVMQDKIGDTPCFVCDGYLNIPPLAMYATEAEAKDALAFFTPIRTREALNATR